MKKIYLIISTSFIILFLTACGGGGGGGSSSKSGNTSGNNTSGNITKVTIVTCSDSNPIFTTIESGDLLVKEVTPTSVNIVHDTDDNKKVCVITGSAYLLR